jgi:hypothetical protein
VIRNVAVGLERKSFHQFTRRPEWPQDLYGIGDKVKTPDHV